MAANRKHVWILIALFATTAVLVEVATRHRPSQSRSRLPDWQVVSYQIGRWYGVDVAFDPAYGEDPAQTSLLRLYQRKTEESITAYLGYHTDLTKILDLHTPELCYPSQGWRILSQSNATISHGDTIPAKEMLVEKAGKRQLVLWWYMAGPRPFKNRIRYVYAMLAMSTLTGRTDGTFVRFETPIEDGQETEAKERIEDFARTFQAEIEKVIPR